MLVLSILKTWLFSQSTWILKNLHQPIQEWNFVSNNQNMARNKFIFDFSRMHKMLLLLLLLLPPPRTMQYDLILISWKEREG